MWRRSFREASANAAFFDPGVVLVCVTLTPETTNRRARAFVGVHFWLGGDLHDVEHFARGGPFPPVLVKDRRRQWRHAGGPNIGVTKV